jgi:hypothetical protein
MPLRLLMRADDERAAAARAALCARMTHCFRLR